MLKSRRQIHDCNLSPSPSNHPNRIAELGKHAPGARSACIASEAANRHAFVVLALQAYSCGAHNDKRPGQGWRSVHGCEKAKLIDALERKTRRNQLPELSHSDVYSRSTSSTRSTHANVEHEVLVVGYSGTPSFGSTRACLPAIKLAQHREANKGVEMSRENETAAEMITCFDSRVRCHSPRAHA